MNRRKNQRKGKTQNHVKVKVTRCRVHKKPVFEHETCNEFTTKTNPGSGSEKICRNCDNSF